MKVKNPKDFLAGLMFIVFGLFFVIGARNYQLGSAARMGPAYFPTLLGTLIGVLPGIGPVATIAMLTLGIPSNLVMALIIGALILGFVLGPMMEENLRRALLLSRGDPTVLFTRPISAGFLIAAIILLGIVLAPTVRKKREEVFEED